jgi:ATP-binding cassette subfamily B protein
MFVAPVPAFIADTRYGVRTFYLELWGAPIKRRMDYLVSLLTTDGAAKEVRVFGIAGFLRGRYRLLGSTFYQRMRRLTIARYGRSGAWGLLSTLVGAVAFGYVALGAASGRLSIGDLALYTAAVTSVQVSVQMIFRNLSTIHENVLYMTELDNLLARRPAITAPPQPRALPEPVTGAVVFDDVTFAYPGSKRPALDRVSLRIEPGQTVAIVGENGAGKSTLVKLLCRLYDPGAGRILCDGVDLRELDPAVYRENITAIFQDHCLYQATAAENIGLGAVAHIEDRSRVERAARAAGVDSLLEGMPQGYDTPLGKWFARGVQLSGGQWQKVALARAFMRDAPLLALDEPTAALDARAEHDLFLRLAELTRGRTTLYISHRFSTVRQADRIVVLDQGRVTEDGTHAELLALGGRYAELYHLQAAAYTSEPDGVPVGGTS